MEYIIFGMILLVLFLAYAVRCVIYDKKKRQAFKKSLYTNFGKASEKKYPEGRLHTIAGHYRKHDVHYCVDDITWNDLDMDSVFKTIDYTFSAAGEESLYTMLRCPCLSQEELLERERLVQYFYGHEDERVTLQLFFAKMGRTGKYSIYDYIEYMDTLGTRKNTKHYIVLGAMLAAALVCFVKVSAGLPVIFFLIAYNMMTYFKEKKEIDPYITTFGYFLRVLQIVKELDSYQMDSIRKQTQEMQKRAKKFAGFSRFSFILMRQSDMTSGNPFDLVIDYLRMMLHLNLIKFNTMLAKAQEYKDDIIFMIETLGYIEAMISIGCYRASMPYYVIPEFRDYETISSGAASSRYEDSASLDASEKKQSEERQSRELNNKDAHHAGNQSKEGQNRLIRLSAEEIYHPLIEEPVANSVSLKRGMLLTGSNASGKSTFLKTVAVAQILSQTIHTAPARCYQTSFYKIYTSMALRDDLAAKESYFIVEIKAMKRILDAISNEDVPVMCFVDEVLRGTNTVERIAASTQILKSLAKGATLPFAATHDIELTELLAQEYENYHFEETVEDGDVKFNYCLQQGKASSRNAIRLLGLMGYDETMIRYAEEMAQYFLENGEWTI